MKTILLLGGSAQQVVAIKKAKELGYRTVLCDYLPDNPGKDVADVFYLVSTTDKEAVLGVAVKEHIDGIVAYASDPAALTAAYVAEELGLPTNPYNSVEILSHKNSFREYLHTHGFHCPKTYCCPISEFSLERLDDFSFPVIVKPIDSSGSKGVTVVADRGQLADVITKADSFSREKKIIVEEFIEKSHPFQVGGDIFVSNGKIVIWGLLNCHRSTVVNPLVPIGKSYPLRLDEESIKKVKAELSRLLEALNITMGAFNIEAILDDKGNVYLIEVGPRNGGNMIPDLLQYITGIDVISATIQSAMGYPMVTEEVSNQDCYYATHNLHSSENGKFRHIKFSEKLQDHLIKAVVYKEAGDQIEYFSDASKVLGVIFLKFSDAVEQESILGDISSYYHVELLD